MQNHLRHRDHAAKSTRRSKIAARLLSLALIVPALIMPTMAQAAPCASTVDQTSLQVRMLQTELMVAALTCNQRLDYNAFITRFQPELTLHGKHLVSFFKQKHGAGSAKALNGFITRIANESSRRGMQKRGEFCRNAASIHASSKNIQSTGLAHYAKAQPFANLHGVKACPTKVAASQTTK